MGVFLGSGVTRAVARAAVSTRRAKTKSGGPLHPPPPGARPYGGDAGCWKALSYVSTDDAVKKGNVGIVIGVGPSMAISDHVERASEAVARKTPGHVHSPVRLSFALQRGAAVDDMQLYFVQADGTTTKLL